MAIFLAFPNLVLLPLDKIVRGWHTIEAAEKDNHLVLSDEMLLSSRICLYHANVVPQGRLFPPDVKTLRGVAWPFCAVAPVLGWLHLGRSKEPVILRAVKKLLEKPLDKARRMCDTTATVNE